MADTLGQYYDLPLGMSVYAAAVAATGLSMGSLWWYVSYRHRLIDERLEASFLILKRAGQDRWPGPCSLLQRRRR
jgi:hypothetical protein